MTPAERQQRRRARLRREEDAKAKVFGLWTVTEGRFEGKDGKVYRFLSCVTVAPTPRAARRQAQRHGAEYGVNWKDVEAVACDTVRHYGPRLPAGHISFFTRT